MVLTGAAGDFCGLVPGTAPHPVAQTAFQMHIGSHMAGFPNDIPIRSSKFLPGHMI
jgi:hypothetical protein